MGICKCKMIGFYIDVGLFVNSLRPETRTLPIEIFNNHMKKNLTGSSPPIPDRNFGVPQSNLQQLFNLNQ